MLTSRPRPLYPKSWLWPEEYAATLIQKTVRQYFVQKQEEVQEMREFWKVIIMIKRRKTKFTDNINLVFLKTTVLLRLYRENL